MPAATETTIAAAKASASGQSASTTKIPNAYAPTHMKPAAAEIE